MWTFELMRGVSSRYQSNKHGLRYPEESRINLASDLADCRRAFPPAPNVLGGVAPSERSSLIDWLVLTLEGSAAMGSIIIMEAVILPQTTK
jgi:hypothetical protein